MKFSNERILCHPCSRLWRGEKPEPRFKKKQSHKGPTINFNTITRELDIMADCYEKRRQARLSKAPEDMKECLEKPVYKKSRKEPLIEDIYCDFVESLEKDLILRKKVALHSMCSKMMLSKAKNFSAQSVKMTKCDCCYCWRPESAGRKPFVCSRQTIMDCELPPARKGFTRQCRKTEDEQKCVKEDESCQYIKKWAVTKCGNCQKDKKCYKKYVVSSDIDDSGSSCELITCSDNGNAQNTKEYLVIEKSENSSLKSDLCIKRENSCKLRDKHEECSVHFVIQNSDSPATALFKRHSENNVLCKFEHQAKFNRQNNVNKNKSCLRKKY